MERGKNATPIRVILKPAMLSNKEPIKKQIPDLVVKHNANFKKRHDNELLVDKSSESDYTDVPYLREHEVPSTMVVLEHTLWKRSENATPIGANKKLLMSSNKELVNKATPDFVL